MLNAFSCTCWPFGSLLWKNVYSDHLPIFYSITLFGSFFAIESYEFFIYFGYYNNLQSSYPYPCPHSSGTSECLPITCCRLPRYCSSAAVSHTQGRCVCRVCPRGCPQLLPPQAVTTPSLPGREQRAGRGCGRRPAPPRLPGASPQMLSQPLAGMLRPSGAGVQTSTGPKMG